MNYLSRDLERIAKGISDTIEDEMDRVGIFHRTFFRCKESASVYNKVKIKGYNGENKFLTDIIGIRTNLYFADDIDIVYPYFRSFFSLVEETKDVHFETEFKPTRLNLVFKIDQQYGEEFRQIVTDREIADTFEFQIRTVLSEGWHEVDHDLRYKCKSDWRNETELGRIFNGILASLEASDWAIIKLFDTLCYQNYKKFSIESMIRSKFRIRMLQGDINEGLKSLMVSDHELVRSIFKIERKELLIKFLKSPIMIPMTISNFIFLLNCMIVKDDRINSLMPLELSKEFERARLK